MENENRSDHSPMIQECPNCGHLILMGRDYCDRCGWQIERKYAELEQAFCDGDYAKVRRLIDSGCFLTADSQILVEERRASAERRNKENRTWTVVLLATIAFFAFCSFSDTRKTERMTEKSYVWCYTQGYKDAVDAANDKLREHELYEIENDGYLNLYDDEFFVPSDLKVDDALNKHLEDFE